MKPIPTTEQIDALAKVVLELLPPDEASRYRLALEGLMKRGEDPKTIFQSLALQIDRLAFGPAPSFPQQDPTHRPNNETEVQA